MNTQANIPVTAYAELPIQHHTIGDATIAVRSCGQGPDLVLIHGFRVHGYTWRKLLPALSQRFRCHVVDLPGLGDSDWTATTDFRFSAQAQRLMSLIDNLALTNYALIGHDTGATIARLIAIARPDEVRRLVMINTEVPGHRPPWIRLYRFSAGLPLAPSAFRLLLSSGRFVRSRMAFGQFYSEPALFNAEHLAPYVQPLVTSQRRMQGMLGYLLGVEWDVVDGLREGHGQIKADTLLLWGEDDRTFPLAGAREICAQLRSQLELALDTAVSQRHLSFLESGRARPSRHMVLHLAEALDVPLRERNALLRAAGYSDLFRQRDLDSADMAPVRQALELMLSHHEPNPALVVDRDWNVLMTNTALERLIGLVGDLEQFWQQTCGDGPRNIMRLTFHSAGLRPLLANWADVAPVLLLRLQREAAATGSPLLNSLLEELHADPDIPRHWREPDLDQPLPPVIPLVVSVHGASIRLFSMISTFGTPQDITTDEVRLETFFPADPDTATLLQALAG